MNKLFPVFFLLGTLLLSAGEDPLMIRFIRHGQPGINAEISAKCGGELSQIKYPWN